MASGSPPFSFCSCASLSAADSPGGPAADDQHIDFEGLAGHGTDREGAKGARGAEGAKGAVLEVLRVLKVLGAKGAGARHLEH